MDCKKSNSVKNVHKVLQTNLTEQSCTIIHFKKLKTKLLLEVRTSAKNFLTCHFKKRYKGEKMQETHYRTLEDVSLL